MLTSYFTLRALVAAWEPLLVGWHVGEVFSQDRAELTLALAHPDADQMLKLSVRPGQHYAFRQEGYNRARRNVAALFTPAQDRRITGVRLADRDRMLFFDLEDGMGLRVALFGARANVYLTDAAGQVVEAFLRDAAHAGRPAPDPRAAPMPDTWAAFEARWAATAKTVAQAVARACPLFGPLLAAEVVHRASVTTARPADCTEAERRRLFDTVQALREALQTPTPQIYWQDDRPDAFSLVPLLHREGRAGQTVEPFETVDAAVRVFVRRLLGARRFQAAFDPLEKTLAQAHTHYARQAATMLEQLTEPSRADRYERWGHLLMAAPQQVPPRAETVTLPDLFAPGTEATIPLDPRLTAVENAQRYYDKARQTRQARHHAEVRMEAADVRATEAAALLGLLRGCARAKDVERFSRDEAARLAPFLGAQDPASAGRVPFRRYLLAQGYEVWVGRNAKQNDALTFRHARKYDLWMHARGVPGSHAVLRLPNRQAEPSPQIKEQAAGIAAYHSKARGSHLAPVIVVPRKYVRKPRGAAPGAVLVERETVLLVEPGVPR